MTNGIMKFAIAAIVFFETLQVLIAITQDNEAPNDFLLSKWKVWYKAIDVDNDGVISHKYVEEASKRFSELHHLAGDEKMSVEEVIEKSWNNCIFHGKYGNISEQEFVDDLTYKFKADKQTFLQTMRECFEIIANVVDADGDGSISEEEYVIDLVAYGHENFDLDTQFFEAYSPFNGLVPVEVIVASWVEFTTSEDESKPSVEKTNFESGV